MIIATTVAIFFPNLLGIPVMERSLLRMVAKNRDHGNTDIDNEEEKESQEPFRACHSPQIGRKDQVACAEENRKHSQANRHDVFTLKIIHYTFSLPYFSTVIIPVTFLTLFPPFFFFK